jgi:hypothetical protein
LGQYIEHPKKSLIIPGCKTISTDDRLWQLAKVKAAIPATLDERIPGAFLIPTEFRGHSLPELFDEIPRGKSRFWGTSRVDIAIAVFGNECSFRKTQ